MSGVGELACSSNGESGLQATTLIPLSQTWPLTERKRQFDLGSILNCGAIDIVKPHEVGQLGIHHAGCWECDLADDSLLWSGGVYDIFGLPRGMQITRDETVRLYSEESRAVMERLRAYAIKHRRGFTLDAEIRAAIGEVRWMRLIAVPVCDGDRTVRLHGLKLII
jgi:PAS domain-containing protein